MLPAEANLGPQAPIAAVARHMRRGRTTVIEGGGHLVGVTHAEAVWRAVAACLEA